jgi:hypothetical protein
MGKNPNTFQKRQREFEKKRKAEDKRKRRLAQKNAPASPISEPVPETEENEEKADSIVS